jgi:5,10-methylenetetrahydromethanopterin reductase
MAAEVRFSLRMGSGVGLEEFRGAALLAEKSGFAQIWTGNDLFRRSGIVPVTLALDATSTIRVGTSVLNPVSLHPAEIAMLASNLQELSGGRFQLGLGAGSDVFLGWAGLAPEAPVTRTARAIVELRALLSGEAPEGLGRDGLPWAPQGKLKDGPARPTPIYVGGLGPKMLELAGRRADGALALCLPPTRFDWFRDRIETGFATRDASAVPAADFDLAACLWCSIDDDEDAARALLAEKIAMYSGSLSRDSLAAAGLDVDRFDRVQQLHTEGRIAEAIAEVDASMLTLGIAGSVTAVIDQCLALAERGVRHFSFGQPLGPDTAAAISALGASVLPEVQKAVTP